MHSLNQIERHQRGHTTLSKRLGGGRAGHHVPRGAIQLGTLKPTARSCFAYFHPGLSSCSTEYLVRNKRFQNRSAEYLMRNKRFQNQSPEDLMSKR